MHVGMKQGTLETLSSILHNRDAHFPVFQFPVGKREIWAISRSGKTGKSGKMVMPKNSQKNSFFLLFYKIAIPKEKYCQ